MGFQLERSVNFLTAGIRETRASLTHVTQTYSGIPSAATGDSPVERVVSRLEDLSERLACEKEALTLWNASAERLIRTLSDRRRQTLFALRHLEKRPWDRVAERLCLSRAQAFRIHDQGLPELQKLLDEMPMDKRLANILNAD